jgi:hypothetical protein
MSSIASSDKPSNWEIEKRCIGIAFAAGLVLLIAGIGAGAMYMVAGAILYSGSIVATAIRDTKA